LPDQNNLILSVSQPLLPMKVGSIIYCISQVLSFLKNVATQCKTRVSLRHTAIM